MIRTSARFTARFAAALALVLTGTGASLAAEPLGFETPEAAAEAVIAALEAKDRDRLVAIFGAENEDVILTGEEPRDRADWSAFLRAWQSRHEVGLDADNVAVVALGPDLWPFPIPIVKGEDGWRFDAPAGREELRLRRIGENELDVIDLLHGYVQAQADYRRLDPDGDGVHAFAAAILSSAGARDGLYWPDEEGAPESPASDVVARATADGYVVDGADADPEPYLGYYYRVLTAQGPQAPGGAFDYMVAGRMLAGHALLAFPSDYGESGVMSFMVAEDGTVYEADLGEDTLETAAAITAFDPGPDWSPVEPE